MTLTPNRKYAQLGICSLLLWLSFSLTLPAAHSSENFTEPTTGMELVFIHGGTFLMGDSHVDGREREKPAHEVKVPDYYIGKFEVTFDQYDMFCAATERAKPGDAKWGRGNRPVINVTWQDAVDFSLWLSQTSGRIFRLPSEAEWEYAARGGTKTKYWWGDEFEKQKARCRDCAGEDYHQETAPVGNHTANPWGLHDITGNVFEWTLDNYHPDYKGAPTDGSPWYQGGDKEKKMVRGGGWTSGTERMMVTSRDWEYPVKSNNDSLGFRLVMEAGGFPLQPAVK